MSNGAFDWLVPLAMVGAPVALEVSENVGSADAGPASIRTAAMIAPPGADNEDEGEGEGEPELTEASAEVNSNVANRFGLRAARYAGGSMDTDAVFGPETLLVCSWNIKWFGKQAAASYRLDWVADFVEECDVVAIQEVSDPHHRAVFAGLIGELDSRGHEFRYRISAPTGYDDSGEQDKNDYLERFAFLWNDQRVRLRGSPWFLTQPIINNPTYRQVPWVASFEARTDHGFDFHVATAHTVYNKKLQNVRREEIEGLRDWVLGAAARREKNAIAIGDFNANPSGQTAHFRDLIPDTTTALRVLMYEPGLAEEASVRTTPPTKEAMLGTKYYQEPVYDHALVSLATDPALPGSPATFQSGFVGVWRFDDHEAWDGENCNRQCRIAAVSDHRPIWVALDYHARDED